MEIGDSQLLNETNGKLREYCSELRTKISLNKNVLFINCPQFNIHAFESEVAKNRGYYAYSPTGLQCLLSALDGFGLDIDIFDLNYHFLKKVILDSEFNYQNWISILKDFLKDKDYSIIGVSNLYNVEEEYFRKIVEYLRAEKKCIIVSGGQNATYNSREFLDKGLVDFICERESENKINFLFNILFNQESESVPGILFKYKGEIVKTGGKKDIVGLRSNLINAHKKLPIEDYCNVGSLNPFSRMVGRDVPYSGILMNRGCRGGCKFCSVRDYMGIGIRSRNVEEVYEEIDYLYHQRGIRYFEILDDDFTAIKSKTMELLQKIIDNNLYIKWGANNGLIASTLDEELLSKMRDSGCVGFKIGVESGNAEILRAVNKPGTLESFRKFSKIIQKFPEIFVIDDYIFGFPGENFSKILESYYFSHEMNLDWSSLSIYQPNESELNSEVDKKDKGDFIPTKDSFKGKFDFDKDIFSGMDVFRIPKERVPSREQIKEIWFVFNLTRNFIHNKNLKPGGNPEKFISFTKTLTERYPAHPYINFFLSLSYNLIGDEKKSKEQYEKMIKNLEDDYWKERFKQFSFDGILKRFPSNIGETRTALEFLRRKNEG